MIDIPTYSINWYKPANIRFHMCLRCFSDITGAIRHFDPILGPKRVFRCNRISNLYKQHVIDIPTYSLNWFKPANIRFHMSLRCFSDLTGAIRHFYPATTFGPKRVFRCNIISNLYKQHVIDIPTYSINWYKPANIRFHMCFRCFSDITGAIRHFDPHFAPQKGYFVAIEFQIFTNNMW